jgi:hypothetical protein
MAEALAQFVQLLVAVLAVGSLVRALMPRGTQDLPAFLRRRAEWLTVSCTVVAGYLVALVVLALTGPTGPDRFGLIPFLVLCAHLTLSWVVLRGAWVRFAEARAAAEDEERRRQDLPRFDGADAPAPPHRGLSGEIEPPRRW